MSMFGRYGGVTKSAQYLCPLCFSQELELTPRTEYVYSIRCVKCGYDTVSDINEPWGPRNGDCVVEFDHKFIAMKESPAWKHEKARWQTGALRTRPDVADAITAIHQMAALARRVRSSMATRTPIRYDEERGAYVWSVDGVEQVRYY